MKTSADRHDEGEAKDSASPARLTSYNLAWRVIRPALGFVLRRRSRKGKEDPSRIDERFGRYNNDKTSVLSPGSIWVHAVSVGESVAALALIDALAKQQPTQHFVITTNTVTAAKMIERTPVKAHIRHLYQPLDHPDFVDRFLAYVKPAAAIFMESDFWPNLITRAKARGIKVVFASTQLSNTAASRWEQRSTIAAAMFGAADLVLPVNNKQADLLNRLGVKAAAIKTLGSLKMSVSTLGTDQKLIEQLRKIIADRPILLAASTHDGEDAIILDAANQLGDQWFVIIAPRHPERGDAIAELCQQHGFNVAQRSKSQLPTAQDSVYVMDTLGEMGSLFALSDIVFLAGSLLPIGGHNPLEPASFGKPIITGPHVFKNSAEFDAMRMQGLVVDAENAEQIASAARKMHDDEARMKSLPKKATAYVKAASKRQDQAAQDILSLMAADQTET